MSKLIISTLAIGLIFSIAIAAKDTPQVGVKDTPQPNIPRLINYQGNLTNNAGIPQNGSFNMVFSIFNAITGPTLYWTETQTGVTVTDGLFNVLLGSVNSIDSLPLGPNCYLEITVAGEVIVPRQRIVSNGYSYYADYAAYAYSSGGDNAWVRGTPDSVLYTIRQLGIARGGADNALWGDYRYTHTNLGVACTTGTFGENQSYATVGGGYGNKATYWCATVGGGDHNAAPGTYSTVGGGAGNTAAWGATVAGGTNNNASNASATVGGGDNNNASGASATVGGGRWNTASGAFATTVGYDNTASGYIATIGGGRYNRARGAYSVVSGGGSLFLADSNSAIGVNSTIGGGIGNIASGDSSIVGGGSRNIASGINAAVGGGFTNNASDTVATIPGGCNNTASRRAATVGGGGWNTASGKRSTVGGGYTNTASGWAATVGGGEFNTASDTGATVPGGYADTAAGVYSLAAGDRVRIRGTADYTFAFGRDCTTSTPGAVIFYNRTAPATEIRVGIDVTAPTNILTVRQASPTDPIADAWTTYSSKRWKENIRPINNPLDKVMKLKGVYFDWKENKKKDIGMIAEEVGEVIPEIVAYEKNGIDAQSLDYARLVALLIEAMKEQQKEIDALKKEIDRLKTEPKTTKE